MDKKKKMNILKALLMAWMTVMAILPVEAQSVKTVKFCGNSVNDTTGEISLFLKLLDNSGNPVTTLDELSVQDCLNVFEDGKLIIWDDAHVERIQSGKRIPDNFTFSVLIDLNIPDEDKEQIYRELKKLIDSAPDSCVYISFYSNHVTSSEMITSKNYAGFKEKFMQIGGSNFFYDALYSKMAEFSTETQELENVASRVEGYQKNPLIAKRASENNGKNILIVITASGSRLTMNNITFSDVDQYQLNAKAADLPKVFAFYYTQNGEKDTDVLEVLNAYTEHEDLTEDRKGKLLSTDNFDQIINTLGETISKQMYDYVFTYKALKDRYEGDTQFIAKWNDLNAGEDTLGIGSKEHPWIPGPKPNSDDILLQAFVALLTTLLTIAFFILILKALIPWIKSKMFAAKYYKKYVPEANVQRRVCNYCKQELQPGQTIVTKCKHYMHIHCWKINHYKCAEYGQNCNEGIQEHVEWNTLFTNTRYGTASRPLRAS